MFLPFLLSPTPQWPLKMLFFLLFSIFIAAVLHMAGDLAIYKNSLHNIIMCLMLQSHDPRQRASREGSPGVPYPRVRERHLTWRTARAPPSGELGIWHRSHVLCKDVGYTCTHLFCTNSSKSSIDLHFCPVLAARW